MTYRNVQPSSFVKKDMNMTGGWGIIRNKKHDFQDLLLSLIFMLQFWRLVFGDGLFVFFLVSDCCYSPDCDE